MLSSNISSTCPHNMANFGLLTAEIYPVVWGTPANFHGFRVLVALLHGTPVLGVSQTLRRWREGATYIRQGGHHVGHWPTFLVGLYVQSVFFSFRKLCPSNGLTVYWTHRQHQWNDASIRREWQLQLNFFNKPTPVVKSALSKVLPDNIDGNVRLWSLSWSCKNCNGYIIIGSKQ